VKATDTAELLSRAIVVIVRLDDLSIATDLARALLAGGIRAIEFPLTNRRAFDAIARIKSDLPEFSSSRAIVGAGSILSAGDVKEAVNCGADFIVSPVAEPGVVSTCADIDIAAIPGAMTPTEVLAAWRAGATMVKIFPARNLGPSYIKDLLEPLPFLKLLPTGGVTPQNIRAYFDAGATAVGVGSAIVDKQLIASKDWDGIMAKAKAFVDAAGDVV
jgi:2-dehydro-3-deoxyphosphogluconate aldolase / (4S)-4-hydroxy-2-oxoglutarate aldolase